MVDLTNPAVKVEVAARTSGMATVASFADSNTIAIINADYHYDPCSGAVCSQGLTVVNGSDPATYSNIPHLCSDAIVRREIGFSADDRVVVDWWYKFVSDGQARSWCKDFPGGGGGQERFAYNLVGGGPQFTFDGQFHWDCQYGMDANHNCLASGGDVGINGEHFKQGNWWNRSQSAIGYSTDGQVLVLAESNNREHTMQEVHDILYYRLQDSGKTLKDAFKFDGGSVAGFWYYNHAYDSTPGVTIPNVIRVQRANRTCYNLSTGTNPGGAGNVEVQTNSNCAQGKYTSGTNVTLKANPNSSYIFSNWSGDAGGSSNPMVLVIDGNKSVTAVFSSPPQAFGKGAPSNSSAGQPLSLSLDWGDSGGAAGYEYCYDASNDNACSGWLSTGSASQASIGGLSYSTTYYWQVRATNGAGTTYADGSPTAFWSFTTQGPPVSPPGPFAKIAPADGATDQPLNLILDWGNSAEATNYEYCYDTTNDNACSGWLSTGSASQASIGELSYSTTYYWQVRATNAGETTYADGSPTAFWSFTTQSPPVSPPGPFTKSAPANGATNQPLSLSLDWGDSTDATDYEYCYDTSNDNACSAWVSGGSNSQAQIDGLSPGTTYYWQVRATNADGTTYANGSPTTFWSFTTLAPAMPQPIWRALLLVYRNTDVDYLDGEGISRHLTASLPQWELEKALGSFRQYPSIAHDFSNGEALIRCDVVYVDHPVTRITNLGSSGYWLSPSDIRDDLDLYAPRGRYDSVLVHWMRCDSSMTDCTPSAGYGWGLVATDEANGATYATAHSIDAWIWDTPTVGEVWLHEWLHGVAPFYEDRGFAMPAQNADGGGSHGYTWSSTTGWATFYRDLMTGRVLDGGTYKGFGPNVWQSGTILGMRALVLADFFYRDTTAAYSRSGNVAWQPDEQNIAMGRADQPYVDNRLYAPWTSGQTFIVNARAQIPSPSPGPWDSVALILRNGSDEYRANLFYGYDLAQRDSIGITHNEDILAQAPFTYAPGWYNVRMLVDGTGHLVRMKAWPEGSNEPDWQISSALGAAWNVSDVGLRHYGGGIQVDDLFISADAWQIRLPLISR